MSSGHRRRDRKKSTYTIEISVHDKPPSTLRKTLAGHPGHEHVVNLIIRPHIAANQRKSHVSDPSNPEFALTRKGTYTVDMRCDSAKLEKYSLK